MRLLPNSLLFLLLFMCLFPFKLFAQHFEISTGYGFYEAMNASLKYVNRNGSKFGLSYGYDNSIIFRGKYQSAMFDYQRAILKRYKSGPDYRQSLKSEKYYMASDYRYFLDFKFIYWHLVDDYYFWHSVSFIPSVGRNFELSYRWTVSADAGLMFNLVLHRQRLNYLNAGWPYKVMPNFRLLINYRL
jgi:hypothetical protein